MLPRWSTLLDDDGAMYYCFVCSGETPRDRMVTARDMKEFVSGLIDESTHG